MITDKLIVMDAPEIREKPSKEDVVRFLLDNQKKIESTFANDEYLKLDLKHGEVIGIKSTAVIGGYKISDLTALSWVVNKNEKYKDSEIINLGSVKMIYREFGKNDKNSN